MMNTTIDLRYAKNRLFISSEEQEIIKSKRILLLGASKGSFIAECALRLGFENITIIDGHTSETSDHNKENYDLDHGDTCSVDTIYKRLKQINSDAHIKVDKVCITRDNIENYTRGYDIAVNAMELSTDLPLLFDNLCQDNGIHVLHPYNLGWGALIGVITPQGLNFSDLLSKRKIDELRIVEFFSDHEKMWNKEHKWLDAVLRSYKNQAEKFPTPQLSIGTYLLTAMTTKVMFDISLERGVKSLPHFYFAEC